ncbi:MAG: 3-dehydroquinate synthase, partial [Betaproteobacteria bacterium]|nr:3-dehydroquinate synthase [Betaproteobacteria bacterium]
MPDLSVELGARAYPIHIGAGLLGRADLYAPHVGGGAVAVVTNSAVARLYLDRLERALRAAGARALTRIIIPEGEQAKEWQTLDRVFDELLAARCGRDTVLVALGGG